jgi:hypothetical protein
MNNQRICYVIERLQNEDRKSAFSRTVLPRFDSEVLIIKCLETANELYFVLSKVINGNPTNFIVISTIQRRFVNKVKCWEIICYFEKEQPPYYNCPQSFFDLCPTMNPLSLEWRTKTNEIRNKKVKMAKINRQLYKLVEFFDVGDTLIHPTYGELHIQHINLTERAFWCLNEKHIGIRKYKLPLMSLEDWEKNRERKISKTC